MTAIRVFDPAMCCSTGVCGPSVDPQLPRFAADLDWLKAQGVSVERTLLLLDAAEAYHREVLRKASGSPEAVQRLLPRLRDPMFTHVLLVTLPEATPIHEAVPLERDLARADITPFAWVVNQSLTPLDVKDPVLLARRSFEAVHFRELAGHARRTALEPWHADVLAGDPTPV